MCHNLIGVCRISWGYDYAHLVASSCHVEVRHSKSVQQDERGNLKEVDTHISTTQKNPNIHSYRVTASETSPRIAVTEKEAERIECPRVRAGSRVFGSTSLPFSFFGKSLCTLLL